MTLPSKLKKQEAPKPESPPKAGFLPPGEIRMAETIDSLLVSIGLETDANSFKKASNAIKDVTDGMIQLAAVAGVKVDFNALTAGVAKSWSELKRLADITGFTVNQIRGLEFAMRRIGAANPIASGQQFAQMVPELARKVRNGEFDARAYKGTAFNPEQFAQIESVDRVAATGYLLNAYQSMSQQQRQQFRPIMGWQENDDVTRLAERGSGFFQQSMSMSSDYDQSFDPELNQNVQVFNDEMAKLSRNFENLAYALGEDLLPIVNSVLEAINSFIRANPVVSEIILGAGSALASGSMLNKLMGPLSVAGEGGWLSGLLFNPMTVGAAAALTPGNMSYSRDDIQEMSDPQFYWKRRHPGESPQQEGEGITPYEAFLRQRSSTVKSALYNQNARQYLDSLAYGVAAMDNTQNSSAFGRYRFASNAWGDAAAAMGLKDFSHQSQDLAALWLIQRAGQLDNVMKGNFLQATNGLGDVWAALPSSPYAQPTRSVDEMNMLYGYQNTPPYSASYSFLPPASPVSFNQYVDLSISGVGMNEQQIQDSVQRALTETGNNLERSYDNGGW